MQLIIKNFEALSTTELHDIYTLRSRVFVVEQQCAYQDPDDKDPVAKHIMMLEGNLLIGYARLVPPETSYTEPSIGRVVVDKTYRDKGYGQTLMKYSINKTLEMYKDQDIVISAQAYLIEFYNHLGFFVEGESYLEDDIPHIKMRYHKL
jgi:ElaA protein